MILEELCEFLASQCPDTMVVVVGELPSLTSEGVAIHIAGFGPNAEYFGLRYSDIAPEDTTLWRPLVRFFIRTETYIQGQTWAEELRELFHKYSADYAGVLSMLQVGTAVYLGRNPERYYEFQVTFNTHIRSE